MMLCLHVCMCTIYMFGTHGGIRSLRLELQTVVGCMWELNLGPLEELTVHFTTGPSLQFPTQYDSLPSFLKEVTGLEPRASCG